MFIAGDPINTALRNQPTILYFNTAIYGIGWITSAILAALGFGLWGLKEWARKGSIVYTIFMILYGIIVGVISAVFILPKQMEITLLAQGVPLASKDTAVWIAIAVQAGISCVMILIEVLIAFYLTRPKVKAAFAPQS